LHTSQLLGFRKELRSLKYYSIVVSANLIAFPQ